MSESYEFNDKDCSDYLTLEAYNGGISFEVSGITTEMAVLSIDDAIRVLSALEKLIKNA
ncbi:MAG: hypothetical protein JKY14_13580 [Paraglaciecola sp.]|nr:hypothetical protein [Paraglaciecola sp.]